MHQDKASLAALIGSRICHDLISPIGAISNGLELFGMTAAGTTGPEMSLIQQSCDNATARIRFFRIAFGTAGDARPIPKAEARKTLADHYAGTRISAEWHVDHALGRDITQLAYLSALCLETALPQGGILGIAMQDNVLISTARAQTVRGDLPIWDVLNNPTCGNAAELGPAHVQFALLARLGVDQGLSPEFSTSSGMAQLRIALSQERV